MGSNEGRSDLLEKVCAIHSYLDGSFALILFFSLFALHASTVFWILAQLYTCLKDRIPWLTPLEHRVVRGSVALLLWLSLYIPVGGAFTVGEAPSVTALPLVATFYLTPVVPLVSMTQRFLTGNPPIPGLMLFSSLTIVSLLFCRLVGLDLSVLDHEFDTKVCGYAP